MKVRDKNPHLAELIMKLEQMGRQENVPIWGALAEKLNRPRRKRYEANLYKLDKYAKGKETIVVPGMVLGTGEISKPVTVAALKFSRIAEEKIRKAGGRCMSIEKLAEEKAAKGVRIIG